MINKLLKNYKYILIGFFLSALLVVFYYFFTNLAFPESNYNFQIDGSAKLYPGLPVFQTFTAKDNNLSQIKIALKNSSIKIGEKIVFELADENCANILVTDEIRWHTPVGMFYRFNFEKIKDSRDKKYCLRATFFSSQKGDYPEISISKSEIFKDSAFTNAGKNKTYQGRTLVFRPAYENESTWQNLQELNQRMSQYKPWFLKNIYLSAITLLTIILSIIFVLLLFI
jgi:hypothetical protein